MVLILDSESPPASPGLGIVSKDNNGENFLWACSNNTPMTNNKIVRNGNLDRFLNNSEIDLKRARIFGIVTCSRYDTEHLPQLFDGFCQHLTILRLSDDKEIRSSAGTEICHCVHHMLAICHRRVAEGLSCTGVMEIVSDIVIQMETLADYSVMSHELLHCWLEVRWTLVMISLAVPGHMSHPPVSLPVHLRQGSTWSQMLISATCLDMLHLAKQKYHLNESSYNKLDFDSSLLKCVCVKEMWVCLFAISDRINSNFWDIIDLCCKKTVNSQLPEDEDLTMLQYSLPDITDNMLPILLYNLIECLMELNLLDEKQLTIVHNFIRKLTKRNLPSQQQQHDEQNLRMFFNNLCLITGKIGCTIETLSEVWRYISQISVLNSACRLRTMTLDGCIVIPVSSAAWLEVVENISGFHDPTSLIMFSQLCVKTIKFWRNNNDTATVSKYLKVLIGRISLKLTESKLQELNEYGIYHTSTMLLCLSTRTIEDQLTENIHNLASQLLKTTFKKSFTHTSSFLTVFKSCLTFCLSNVSTERSMNKFELVTNIGNVMESLVLKFKATQNDVHLKKLVYDLVKVYMEVLSEVAENSVSLSCDEESLIHSWIGQYLKICSVNEITMIMKTFETILTRSRMLTGASLTSVMPTSEQLEDLKKLQLVINKLWSVVFPAVKQLCNCLTSPDSVGTIAAEFIKLKAEHSETPVTKLIDMVKYFTQNKDIPISVSAIIFHSISHNTALRSKLDKITLQVSAAMCSAAATPGTEAYTRVREAWQVISDNVEEYDTVVLVMLHNINTPAVISSICNYCSDVSAWRDEAVLRQYQVQIHFMN